MTSHPLTYIVYSMRKKALLCLLILSFSCIAVSFAQPPASQQMSGEERQRELEAQDKALIQKIEQPKEKPQVKEELPPIPPPIQSKEKVAVKTINVLGVTLIKDSEIRAIVAPYENTEVTIDQLQEAANKITDVYRSKGYITSRAYLPPQKIAVGAVEIRVLEGAMGSIEVKGNKWFKSRLILRRITLKKGEPFNYNTLRQNLININDVPDRAAKAVLVPGKEPGTTDVVLEVKDRLPIHAGFTWDDFGSRYIGGQRYLVQFTDNNLLGFDDKLTFQYQLAQSSRYFLKNIRYLFPISGNTEIGAFASLSRIKLGKEFEDLDARGKSQVYSLFADSKVFDTENFDISLSGGFDYKNITNIQEGAVTSEDRLRIVKGGFNIDQSDNYGRTLLTYELDYGIPGIMGGLKTESTTSSRNGAGGKFVKNTVNLLRLQKLPFSSSLLWKNSLQFSPYILTAAEEFQLGGIVNVRGYPPAEVVGDSGAAMTWEWSTPFYFIPKNMKFPFSKAKAYDALRFVTFYDWGDVHLRRPLASEEKSKTLRSVGCGMRINLPEDFSLRLEFAWALDQTPSDGDRQHTWAQVSKTF